MSIRRAKAGAGVAAKKGLGAEEQFCAKLFLALRKISVVLSQKCGALSKSRNIPLSGGFVGRGTLFGALLPFHFKTAKGDFQT